MVVLSERLRTIAANVPKGSRLADIGSDHALLPVFLVQNGQVDCALAGELNPGPFEAACKQVETAGLADRISVRRGDGLRVLEAGEADVVTIAGMGGALISHILEEGKERLDGVTRLVLQPNVGEDTVRHWLVANGWWLSSEQLIDEDGRYYEVLTADKCSDASERNKALYAERHLNVGSKSLRLSSEWLYTFGPYLVERGGDNFTGKWLDEAAKRMKIAERLAQSKQETAAAKRETLICEAEWIREVAACLQTGKL